MSDVWWGVIGDKGPSAAIGLEGSEPSKEVNPPPTKNGSDVLCWLLCAADAVVGGGDGVWFEAGLWLTVINSAELEVGKGGPKGAKLDEVK